MGMREGEAWLVTPLVQSGGHQRLWLGSPEGLRAVAAGSADRFAVTVVKSRLLGKLGCLTTLANTPCSRWCLCWIVDGDALPALKGSEHLGHGAARGREQHAFVATFSLKAAEISEQMGGRT